MTTKNPDEVADKLRGYLVDEFRTNVEGPKFLKPFKEAGWSPYTGLVMRKDIESPIDGSRVSFFAQYWASYDEPISVQFDQTGTQWFTTAAEAIEFVDAVIAKLQEQNPKQQST